MLKVTRADGRISIKDAAALCGVKEVTVRNWIYRGYGRKTERRKLTAIRDDNQLWVDPVELARAELATREWARRDTLPQTFLAAA
jgi:hypothetical protein